MRCTNSIGTVIWAKFCDCLPDCGDERERRKVGRRGERREG